MRMRTKGSGAAYGKKSDDDREAGTIALMILALCLIGSVLILGTITVTSAQLARMRLLDAADAAALDAADTVSDVVYVNGVGEAVPLTDAAVVQSASAYLSARPLPSPMQTWTIAPGTGSPDGTSAVVVLTGTAELPIIGSALDALGGSITITVSSRARADVVP